MPREDECGDLRSDPETERVLVAALRHSLEAAQRPRADEDDADGEPAGTG